jgi:TRAP-type C4-dicarboxylate transport system permease small subunit
MQVNNPVANRLLRVVELLSAAGAALSGGAFALMTLLILAEILLRTFFDKSTLIASEYSGYTLAAMIYLGLGFSFRQGAHIRITFLRERLKGWALHLLEIACALVGSLLCILSTVFLWEMVQTSYLQSGCQSGSTPLGWAADGRRARPVLLVTGKLVTGKLGDRSPALV